MNQTFFRRLTGLAALAGAAGVIIGAFGAHSLKGRISPESLEALKTGVFYLFIHVLASLWVAALSRQEVSARGLKLSGTLFLLGVLFFSGSLFLLSTREVTGMDIRAIGLVTPLGGLCFIAGWINLAIWSFQSKVQ